MSPLRKSTTNRFLRRKSNPNTPSTVAPGGKEWQTMDKFLFSTPSAWSLRILSRGVTSTPTTGDDRLTLCRFRRVVTSEPQPIPADQRGRRPRVERQQHDDIPFRPPNTARNSDQPCSRVE